MGFRDTSLLCKIVLILLVLCFCIDLIGFAIPYWITEDGINSKTNIGLWMYCTETNQYKICSPVIDRDLPDWFRAVRAFSIVSWVFFLMALVLVIIFAFFKSEKKALYVGAVCPSFTGAFCALIAFAVFAGEAKLNEYPACFALTIISFILGLIIGILGILDCLGVVGGK
ncbi:hypothetical protein ACJMK2_014663 [Sinanodonta woodiana]|uniref:Uncharacterized protein n=1 Tax=Sinanodonta woodiana TaxID=1069815 RepID=A0ABD3V1B2_SINWO